MNKKEIFKKALVKSLPVFFSYMFLSLSYGILMEEAGFDWFYSLFASSFIYAGAFQFVVISFLSSGASLLTVAVTAFLMGSRQSFYALSFIDDFKSMGGRKLYMIHSLTDETYALNCSLDKSDPERREMMFHIAWLTQLYWVTGSVIGGVLGQLIPMQLEGIDFCMTALFIIIFIDNWEKAASHTPAIIGAVVAVVCLLIFGSSAFMLPALLITSALLLLTSRKEAQT